MANFNFLSTIALEDWDWRTPWTTGIGGSETSHIELATRLAIRGHNVVSYAPVTNHGKQILSPVDGSNPTTKEIPWFHHSKANYSAPGTWLLYRDPTVLDEFSSVHHDQSLWFIAQDVDYSHNWTKERLAKIDRYICLCQRHCDFTKDKLKDVREDIDKIVYKSTNGIRRDIIEQVERDAVIIRNPKKMIYASSPDRGLLCLLESWPRIIARVPEAELHIFYGFDNMRAMEKSHPDGDFTFSAQKKEVLKILDDKPKGVFERGRIPQMELYKEWFSTGLWPYWSDWPESSCITCMEAQACGAVPITNHHWAVGENVFHGVLVNGIPQTDLLPRAQLVEETIRLLNSPEDQEEIRKPMMEDARDTFDWELVVDQIEEWVG